MTGWERNAKRTVKAVLWVFTVMLLGALLDVKITVPLMFLITTACFVDFVLDKMWPTGTDA
jgi:hypothetical protein